MIVFSPILAQRLILPDETGGGTTIQGPMNAAGVFGGNTIGNIINRTIPYILAAAGIGLLLVIISGGFTLLISAGDAKKMESGKARLTNGVIGFVLILTAYWAVQIVGTIFGIDAFKHIFF
jgi:hypothetical protein